MLQKTRKVSEVQRNFLRRQKGLPLRQGDNTSQDRMDAINSETLELYS